MLSLCTVKDQHYFKKKYKNAPGNGEARLRVLALSSAYYHFQMTTQDFYWREVCVWICKAEQYANMILTLH